MTNMVVPLMIGIIIVFGLCGNVKVYDAFTEGAFSGLKTLLGIAAPIVGLMTAISMFRASGALELIIFGLGKLHTGIPEEIVPLAIMRPISGSGALGILSDILKNNGTDTKIGLIASVICGSTETTFYTLSVYFGATKVTNTRYTVLVALVVDIMVVTLGIMVINWLY